MIAIIRRKSWLAILPLVCFSLFILIGQYYFNQSSSGQVAGLAAALGAKLDTANHSMSTEVVVPPQIGCSSSHQGHSAAMHAGH